MQSVTARRPKEPFSFLAFAQVVAAMWFVMVWVAKITTLYFSPLIEYQTTEWVVSYTTGFIRRGLTGEIILRLAELTRMDAIVLIKICGGAVMLIFLRLFVARVLKAPGLTRNERFGLLFMPIGVSFVLLNPHALLRKDYIAFIVYFGFLWILERPGPLRLRPIAAYLAVAGSLAIMMHEIFFLLFVPFVALMLWPRLIEDRSKTQALIQLAAALAVPTLVTAALLAVHPPPGTALKICQHAQTYARDLVCSPLPKALTFIDMGQTSAFTLSHQELIQTRIFGIPVIFIWIAIYVPFAWLHYEILWRIFRAQLGAGRDLDSQVSAAFLALFNAILLTGMSTIGFDLGRWMFLLTSLATLTAASGVCARSLAGWLASLPWRRRINRMPLLRESAYVPCVLIAAFISFNFRIQHCCIHHILDIFWFLRDILEYLGIYVPNPEPTFACLAARCF